MNTTDGLTDSERLGEAVDHFKETLIEELQLMRILRFFHHLLNKIPQWWAISKYEYQLEAVWSTDDLREHRIAIEEIKEANKRISSRLPNRELKIERTERTKRI